jgi:hypothetical protein
VWFTIDATGNAIGNAIEAPVDYGY